MFLLSSLIFGPIIGAIAVYFAGFVSEKLSKALTVEISAVTVAVTLYIFLAFSWAVSGFQLVET